jgi:hypothetical protein
MIIDDFNPRGTSLVPPEAGVPLVKLPQFALRRSLFLLLLQEFISSH